jgi:creatinine amidohydrolase
MAWARASWPELAAALPADPATGSAVGLVPVGAVEQHGPHLPTGTDTIIATALCEQAAGRCDALALPAIPLGVSYGHGTALPGTLSLTPNLLIGIVHQYARWAAVSGLHRLLFINAHLGNSAALSVATDTIRLQAPQLRVGVIDVWSIDAEVQAWAFSDGADMHANQAETSLMLAISPELVHLDELAEADDPDRTGELVFRYTAPALSHNGVTGRPSAATTEFGAQLLEHLVAAIADRVRRGRHELPPLGQAPVPPFPF